MDIHISSISIIVYLKLLTYINTIYILYLHGYTEQHIQLQVSEKDNSAVYSILYKFNNRIL